MTRLEERFWSKVNVGGPDDCWTWTGCLAAGYGRFFVNGELGGPVVWPAHRVSWVLSGRAFQHGVELDHVCHTRDIRCVQGSECPHRRCVNPAHLEVVTHRENAIRRELRLTEFKCGHPYSERVGNGGPSGRCGICHRERERARRSLRKSVAA